MFLVVLIVLATLTGGGSRGLAALYRICVLADLAKVGYESLAGAPLFTDPASLGATPVPLAHALGALGGIVCVVGRGGSGGQRLAAVPGRPLRLEVG